MKTQNNLKYFIAPVFGEKVNLVATSPVHSKTAISEKAPTELFKCSDFTFQCFFCKQSSCSINFGFKLPAGLRAPNPKGFRFKLKERVLKVTCCYKCKLRNPIKEKQQNKTNLGLQTSIIRRFFIVSIFLLFHFNSFELLCLLNASFSLQSLALRYVL